VFEEFFTIGLRMPLHPVLSDILLKFQVQLHQLTPNAIVQLSKYIWAVASFGGVLSAECFAKRYELYYQLRKMDVNGAEVQGQYEFINFHAKRHGGQGRSLPSPLKINGPEPGPGRGSTVRFPYFGAPAPCEVKVYLRSA
jgi:hypothetical protein